MNEGFWADRIGKLCQFNGTHINYIMDNPVTFGWGSLADLKDVFKKHGEKFGWEGKARREIMTKAMSQGWVRIRNNGNRGWFIEYVQGSTTHYAVRKAVHSLVDQGFASYDESIRVTPITVSASGETSGRPEEYHVDQETKEGGIAQFLAAAISQADLKSEGVILAAMRDIDEDDRSMHRLSSALKAMGYDIASCGFSSGPAGFFVRVVTEEIPQKLSMSFKIIGDKVFNITSGVPK